MSRRWLLVLGSNLAEDACLRRAMVELEALGEVTQLTPVLLTRARRGDGHYHNALVALVSALPDAALGQALKRIEADLGRVRDGSGVVAIDIDPLAFDEGLGWRPDAHALEKGELQREPVPQLLAQAGIEVAGAGGMPGGAG